MGKLCIVFYRYKVFGLLCKVDGKIRYIFFLNLFLGGDFVLWYLDRIIISRGVGLERVFFCKWIK